MPLSLGRRDGLIKHLFEACLDKCRRLVLDIVQTYDERVFDEETEMTALAWDTRSDLVRTAPRARPARAARPERRHLRLTARGRAVLVVLALLLVAGWALRPTGAAAGGADPAIPVDVVTVTAGQTLWQIASSVTEPGEDVRDVVDRLIVLNGLSDSGLRAGQQLLVPAAGDAG